MEFDRPSYGNVLRLVLQWITLGKVSRAVKDEVETSKKGSECFKEL